MKKRILSLVVMIIIAFNVCCINILADDGGISLFSTTYPEIVDIVAGGYHSIAHDRSGDVYVFGSNRYGEIGIGTTSEEGVVYDISIDDSGKATKVSSRGDHILTIGTDGKVYSWGYNNHGQLGIGNWSNQSSAIAVNGLPDNVIDIAAGHQFSLALTEDGYVYAWGHGGYGQIGNGAAIENCVTPVKINSLSDVKYISAGHYHALAIKNDGTVWGWGRNTEGQLGNGTTTNVLTPVQLTISDVKEAVAGFNNSFFIKNDGTVYACGNNTGGELGDGTQENKTEPVLIEGVSNVVQVSSNSCTVFLQENGIAYGTGSNKSGQLGFGNKIGRVLVPTKIPGEGYTKVSVGGEHTLLYWGTTYNGGTYGGKIYAMGSNEYYQCGQTDLRYKEKFTYPTLLTHIQEIDDRVTWALTGDEASVENKNIIIASEDTYISQNGDTNTSNYATNKFCGVNYTRKENGTDDWGQYSYFKFDVSEIDRNRLFTAKLYLYVDETSDIRSSTRTIGIYDTETFDWTDSELTWNSGVVQYGDNLLGTFNVTGNGSIITDAGWREIDITQYLQEFSGDELSLMAKMTSTTAHPVNIRSRDYYTYTAPVLVVDFTDIVIDNVTSEFMVEGTSDKPNIYSFIVPFDGVYEITNLEFNKLNVRILDSSKKVIYDNYLEYEDYSWNYSPHYHFSHFVNLKANQTYYLYSYKNIQTQLIPHNENYRLESSKMLNIGQGVSAKFENENDFISYKIDISKDGIYKIYTIGNIDTTGYLYDENFELLTQNSNTSMLGNLDKSPEDKNFRIFKYLDEGTYYLGIENRKYNFSEVDTESFSVRADYWNNEPLPISGSEIPYAPSLWIENYSQPSNTRVFANCYGYAINSQLTFLDPGTIWHKLSNQTGELDYSFYKPDTNNMELYPPEVIGERIIEYAKKDAEYFGKTFVEVEENEICPSGTYKVALLLSIYAPENSQQYFDDYHWYRQNPDGTWSHKRGQNGVAKNWDESLQDIYVPTPDYADTDYYNYFVGYYAVEDCSDFPYIFESDVTENENSTILTTYSLNNDLIIEDFDFLEEKMLRKDIVNQLGQPHEQGGSGMLKDIYYLNNNTKMILTYYDFGKLYSAVLINGSDRIKII